MTDKEKIERLEKALELCKLQRDYLYSLMLGISHEEEEILINQDDAEIESILNPKPKLESA
jgi:hypothetical protein